MKQTVLLIAVAILVFSVRLYSMSAFINTTDATCSNANGTATVYVSGGIPSYTFQWSTGDTTQTVTGLTGGTFLSVWVFDSASDSAYASVTINGSANLNPMIMSWAGSYPCTGMCNGSAHLIFDDLGGTAPYTATYDGVPMEPYDFPMPGLRIYNVCWDATGIVYVEDATGCSVTWTEPPVYVTPSPEIYSVTVNGACSGSNGMAIVNDNQLELLGSYSYNYYDSALNPIVTNVYYNSLSSLAAGTYYAELVTVTGYFDLYSYQWMIVPCYSVIQQFIIPDLGPDCENVSGTVFHDDNTDCLMNNGEMVLPAVLLTFNPGPFYAMTNSFGNYSLNLPAGSYTITQNAPLPVYPVCPPANQTLDIGGGGQIVNYNLGDTGLSSLDLAAFLSSTTARPGFNFSYHLSCNNLSYYTSGPSTVTLNYDSSLTYINAFPAPASQTPGQVTWDVNSVLLNSQFDADVDLYVPPSVLLGTTLNASANITSVLDEINLTNNNDATSNTVVGSFDPNVKEVRGIGNYPGPQITASEDLSYTIQFQNTGTDTAFNVVIYDTLSSLLDLNSIFVTYATHEYDLDIYDPGILRFSFNNILLPDSTTNEAASHGYVNFRIGQQAGNVPGTIISNRAAIVFDFNTPVITNDASVHVCEFDTTMNIVSICGGDSVLAGGEWQTQAGIYHDDFSNIYACDSLVITALSVIVIDDSVLLNDALLTSLQSNASYQWNDCDLNQLIAGATNQTYTAPHSGNYSVQITKDGCTVFSDCYEIIVTNALQNEPEDLITIHPNPAGDILNIKYTNKYHIQKITIQNALGQIVYEKNLSVGERENQELNISALPASIYMMIAVTESGKVSKRFVKE